VIPGLDGRFLHNRLTDFESFNWASLGLRPATRWYRVYFCGINTHEIDVYSGGGVLGGLRGDAGDPRTQWQIPSQPLN